MVKELSEHACLNCNTVNPPGNKFCGQCGQKTDTHRISWHEIMHDVVHYFTHADKGIFYLLKKLATAPGVTAREYLAGKRTQYFKPLNFLLIVAALTVFMTSLLRGGNQRPPDRQGSARQTTATLTEEQRKILAARYANVNKITTKYSNFIQILATPLITFFVFLFYLKGPYTYLEHLVANMYFVGAIMIFYSLLIVPLSHFSRSFTIGGILLGVFFVFEIVYRAIAYYQLMNQKGVKYGLKAFGVSLLASVLWATFSYTMIATYMRNGLWGLFA